MSALFKVPPPDADGDVVTLEARAYGPVHLRPGDRIYLWWSEAQGGRGLAGYGLCVDVSVAADRWRAGVEIVNDRAIGYGKADLAPFRNATGAAPEVTLAAKLYRYALNKVVAVTPAEAAFLDALIDGVTPRSG